MKTLQKKNEDENVPITFESKSFFQNDFARLIFLTIPGALLIFDLAFTGSGHWSEPIGFSFRKVMLIIIITYSTFFVVAQNKILRSFNVMLGLVFFILIWCFFLPLIHGVQLVSSLTDGQLFIGLLFAPVIATTVLVKNSWSSSLQLIKATLLVLSLVHIFIYWYAQIASDSAGILISILHETLEPNRSIDETSIYIGPLLDGFRVFWGSSIFLFIGFYLSMKALTTRRSVAKFLNLFIFSYAISLTMTRGLILSIPLYFLVFLLIDKTLRKFYLNAGLYLLFGIILSGLTLPILVLANPDLLSAIGLGREVSDDLRYEQASALLDGILKSPILGNGLGANVTIIRSETAPWSYELSILALFMKIGLLGAAWLITLFTWFMRAALIEVSQHQPILISERKSLSHIAALIFSIIFCSNTNPYLFSMIGWGFLMFIYIELRNISISRVESDVVGLLSKSHLSKA